MITTVQNDIEQFMGIFPGSIRELLVEHDLTNLMEVVLDVARLPEARFFDHSIDLGSKPVTPELFTLITAQLCFGDDNRAGMSGTLHRISAIRDRKGTIVGLTCRVGRAIFGTASVIEDLLASGKSVLVLGRPGLGKTTRLRDAARLLSTGMRKRVIIIDTSNEIAGDGSVPHPAIGRARRMQVPTPARQALVMIEAVENHTPEVIVIDEIGDSKDVAAARTIAERGVQLIATAHGFTIASIIDNPMLSDLVGGCQSVVLGDEEAKRRGTRKSIVERKHSATFDVIVEIVDFNTLAIYPDAAEAVDTYLNGCTPLFERRLITPEGVSTQEIPEDQKCVNYDAYPPVDEYLDDIDDEDEEPEVKNHGSLRVYTLGLSRNNVADVIYATGTKFTLVGKPEKADLILVVAKRAATVAHCKVRTITVRSNTKNQIRDAIASQLCDD